MSRYDSLLKDNTQLNNESKNITSGRYDSLLKDIKPTFTQRMTGEPVKQRNGSYKATTGILPFLGAIPKETFNTAKGLVQGTINTGKTLGQSIATNAGAFDSLNKANIESGNIALKLAKQINENKKLGKDTSKLETTLKQLQSNKKDTIQTLVPNTQKTNLQALGDIGMMASEVLLPGEAGLAAKTGKLLTTSAIKNIIAKKTLSETERMLAKKTLFNVLTGYGYDVSSKLSEGKTDIKDISKPGLITLMSAVFSGAELKGMLKTAKNNESKVLLDRALEKANFGKIPEAGTPPISYFNKNVKQLEAPYVDNVKIEPINGNTIQQNVKYKNPTQKQLATGYEPYTPNEKLPEISYNGEDNIIKENQPINNKSITNEIPIQSNVNNTIKNKENKFIDNEISSKSESSINTNLENNGIKVDNITLKDIKDKSTKFIEDNGIEKARRVALGIDVEPFKNGASGIHGVLVNYAEKNDPELLKELVYSDVLKESAQNISLGRIKNPDSSYYILKDIRNSLENESNPLKSISKKSEISSSKTKLETILKSVETLPEDIIKIAKSMICE